MEESGICLGMHVPALICFPVQGMLTHEPTYTCVTGLPCVYVMSIVCSEQPVFLDLKIVNKVGPANAVCIKT